MTNISAFKIYEGKGKTPQNAVMVADSMTTMSHTGQKDDSAQKLFVLNGALVMHSGARETAIGVYEELMKSQTNGPESISKSILDISTRHNFPPQMPLDFIVSGYEEGKVKIFYINATGFNPYDPNKSVTTNKHLNEQFYAFSGSGSPFANRVVSGQVDLGLDPRPKDITSGISLMRTIAQTATESAGVNDKLQYGIITPEGMHVLFHPTMRAHSFETHANYLQKLFSTKISEYGEFGTEDFVNLRDKNRPLWLLARDFYNAFDLDLSMLSSASRDFRTISDIFRESKISVKRLTKERDKYQKAKEIADKAVAALLSGNKKGIAGYVRQERKLRESHYPV